VQEPHVQKTIRLKAGVYELFIKVLARHRKKEKITETKYLEKIIENFVNRSSSRWET